MPRDLNGNPVEISRWKRWSGRLAGGRKPNGELSADDLSLVVTAESFDEAEAASSVLADSGWREHEQSVLRHLLVLPSGSVRRALELAAQDHYGAIPVPPGIGVEAAVGNEVVVLARVQLIDALHVSQERSRMAGLAQRHGGYAVGWQVLQPPTNRVPGNG